MQGVAVVRPAGQRPVLRRVTAADGGPARSRAAGGTRNRQLPACSVRCLAAQPQHRTGPTSSHPPQARYIPQLPEGWVKCPRFGDPRFFEGLNIIPCKVPLGPHFNQQTGPSGRWTLADAILQFQSYGMEVRDSQGLGRLRQCTVWCSSGERTRQPPAVFRARVRHVSSSAGTAAQTFVMLFVCQCRLAP